MTTATTPSPRTYRLPPRDRTGWMFGLSLAQLVVISVGVVAGTVLMVVAPVVVGLVVMAVFVTAGGLRLHGAALLDLVPHGLRFMRLRRNSEARWLSVVPLVGGAVDLTAPPALAELELLSVDAHALAMGRTGEYLAVSHDMANDTIAATIRVAGRQFGLLEPGDQDWLISLWGIALQAFVNERTPVASIRWSEWAAPAGLDEHRSWVGEHRAEEPVAGVEAVYESLLTEVGAAAVRHETLVTVTVSIGKVRRRRADADRVTGAVETLLEEVRLFGQRLDTAGLIVSAPLSPTEWARAMRLRIDPASLVALDGRLRSLGETNGRCSPENAHPLAVEQEWTFWRTDGAVHRALSVAEWPRLDVRASWLRDLVLWAGSVRSLTVVFEPVARSRSQRSIVREAAKIESDAAHRTEKGFRVGANHRRAIRAVEEREEELVAGYGEFTYAGIVTVTAASLDELDAATADVIQVAASTGIDLRPLHGRHDLAVAATLPIARGVVPKEWL